jgi:glutamate racemase
MIGVFDSGLGGLSVLAALVDALPAEDFTYFADTAHMPYGEKDDAYIQRRALVIGDELGAAGCRVLVVACNTATTAAVEALRAERPDLVIVGVEPGIKPAVNGSQTRKVGVLATPSTARSARLQKLIAEHADGCEVHVEGCPDWVPHIERLVLDAPELIADVRHRVGSMLDWGADRIVLGCTHYSFLKPLMLPLTSGRAELVEVNDAVARRTRTLVGDAAQGHGRLYLRASAHLDRLHAALPALGLTGLADRLVQPQA